MNEFVTMPGALAEPGITDVWNYNMDEEFDKMRETLEKYPYVAMDTEFPGVVARPIGDFKSSSDYQYQLLRCNVDLLKIIQIGFTFYNDKGEQPAAGSTWQFNFKFNLGEDMYAQDSIDLLLGSGIQFKGHEEDGVDVYRFAEFLYTSGIILSDDVYWLSFHSGYDFGYLLKLLTDQALPAEESEFFDLLRLYFPKIYDVKYLMKSCKSLKGGLQEVSEILELERVGPQHQAGSDSLLTGAAFFKMREIFNNEWLMIHPSQETPHSSNASTQAKRGASGSIKFKEMFFEDNIDDDKYCGHLFGLGASYSNGVSALAFKIGQGNDGAQ